MRHGKPCAKHPELNGLRHNGGNCPACTKAAKKLYQARNREKVSESMRAYREANKDRAKELNARWRGANKMKLRAINLRRNGFTPALFEAALDLQGGRCAICKVDLATIPTKQVHADHCHATGLARGVLCHQCNAGLGSFRDSLPHLHRAIDYLINPTLELI